MLEIEYKQIPEKGLSFTEELDNNLLSEAVEAEIYTPLMPGKADIQILISRSMFD